MLLLLDRDVGKQKGLSVCVSSLGSWLPPSPVQQDCHRTCRLDATARDELTSVAGSFLLFSRDPGHCAEAKRTPGWGCPGQKACLPTGAVPAAWLCHQKTEKTKT